jgi:hypothetical protein
LLNAAAAFADAKSVLLPPEAPAAIPAVAPTTAAAGI